MNSSVWCNGFVCWFWCFKFLGKCTTDWLIDRLTKNVKMKTITCFLHKYIYPLIVPVVAVVAVVVVILPLTSCDIHQLLKGSSFFFFYILILINQHLYALFHRVTFHLRHVGLQPAFVSCFVFCLLN